ncbi:integrase family protein [Nitrosococcus halophilus Nc 4]|uniref:Integrase family protein n=1 Tax=Nitrosococcus halophilus (strain Nc4) TaxID=472759 RepID=D5C3Q8_NITHN|nr:DUF6538 domain-containing protein [Nitrosococcus halophilus]ADE15030.1 integrase family protein [Nitrosococcus halophilus Nc 4]
MNKRYLLRRRQTWYIRIRVPDSLYPVIGKKHITRSLKTRDIHEARARRWSVVKEIKAYLNAQARQGFIAPDSPEVIIQRAKETRNEINLGLEDPENAEIVWDVYVDQLIDRHGKPDPETGEPKVDEAIVTAVRLGYEIISSGKGVMLASQALEENLEELRGRQVLNQTIRARERRVNAFLRWLGGDRKLKEISREDAGRYVTQVLLKRGNSQKTVKDTISDLSAFFNWAMERGQTVSNPFRGMSKSVRDTTRGTREKKNGKRRVWTQKELKHLLLEIKARLGEDDPLWAMTVIALYTGMRENEIAETRLEDVHSDHIHIPEGKTESSIRDTPIHPLLKPFIEQLKASSTEGYLISGLIRGGEDNKRHHYFAKRFGRFKREKAGLTDSRIVFHSFRKNFAGALEQAGVSETLAQQIVGHKKQSLTYGLYSPGVDLEKMAEAVAMVSYGAEVDRLCAEGL